MSEVKNEGLEVVAYQYQDREDKWCNFTDEKHLVATIEDGTWPIRELCHHSEALAGYAVRDERIAELEAVVRQRNGELTSTNRVMCSMVLEIVAVGEALGISGEDQDGGTAEFVEAIDQLRAELAAIKAQEPVAWMLKNEKGRIEEILPYMPCASDMQPYWPEPFQLYAAPVAKQVVMPDHWEDALWLAMERAFELGKHHDEGMVVDDTQVGVEFATKHIRDMIARLNAADQGGGQDE